MEGFLTRSTRGSTGDPRSRLDRPSLIVRPWIARSGHNPFLVWHAKVCCMELGQPGHLLVQSRRSRISTRALGLMVCAAESVRVISGYWPVIDRKLW